MPTKFRNFLNTHSKIANNYNQLKAGGQGAVRQNFQAGNMVKGMGAGRLQNQMQARGGAISPQPVSAPVPGQNNAPTAQPEPQAPAPQSPEMAPQAPISSNPDQALVDAQANATTAQLGGQEGQGQAQAPQQPSQWQTQDPYGQSGFNDFLRNEQSMQGYSNPAKAAPWASGGYGQPMRQDPMRTNWASSYVSGGQRPGEYWTQDPMTGGSSYSGQQQGSGQITPEQNTQNRIRGGLTGAGMGQQQSSGPMGMDPARGNMGQMGGYPQLQPQQQYGQFQRPQWGGMGGGMFGGYPQF